MNQLRLPNIPAASGSYSAPALRSLPLREHPVERVTYVGAQAVSLAELLAAIVGGPYQVEVALALLSRFGGVTGMVSAPIEELAQTPHLGKARAAALKAALEMGRRLAQVQVDDRLVVRSPTDVASLLMAEMGCLEQEHFRVLFLDTRNRLMGDQTLYVGSLNASHIRVAEVFREAIRRNSAAIIVCHNHPSSDCSPSSEDVEVTRQLVAAGNLLDIETLDHLVVGRGGFVSLRERGLGFNN
jgi:DNA repair protein RadC